MKVHKFTPYDAGQALIACADILSDKELELRNGGYIELAEILRKCRFKIGKAFNQHGSHEFGLPKSEEELQQLRSMLTVAVEALLNGRSELFKLIDSRYFVSGRTVVERVYSLNQEALTKIRGDK